jgi:hypothetical protein
MITSRHNAILPRPFVFMLGECKRGAGKLLSVKTHRSFLRIVPAFDKRAWERFGLEVVAKAVQVLEIFPM